MAGMTWGVQQVKIVSRAVEIGGHRRDETGAVLAVIRLAHRDAGDLRHRVGLIGGFQFAVRK